MPSNSNFRRSIILCKKIFSSLKSTIWEEGKGKKNWERKCAKNLPRLRREDLKKKKKLFLPFSLFSMFHTKHNIAEKKRRIGLIVFFHFIDDFLLFGKATRENCNFCLAVHNYFDSVREELVFQIPQTTTLVCIWAAPFFILDPTKHTSVH